MKELRERAGAQFRRNGYSQSLINRLTRHLGADDDILIIGCARRFAAYKRATLVFSDPARLARRLVTGVDVWLNTPRYPLEASATSGMKAGINGVPHLSILDGWWPEGYDGRNGWGIAPQSAWAPAEPPAHTEAQELLDILEYEVIPLYYDRNRQGYSPGWINKAKASMKSLIPRYGAERMVMDYVRKFYSRAALQQERLAADNFAAAIELAQWKQRVGECWPKVRLQLLDQPKPSVRTGEQLRFCAAVHLGGLAVPA